MGPKKKRCVNFAKLRKDLVKETKELSVLCDADVLLNILSPDGKLFQYSSSQNPDEILERYQVCKKADHVSEDQVNRFGRSERSSEPSQMVERQLVEKYLDQLSVTDLIQLEKIYEALLKKVESRKIQLLLQAIEEVEQRISKLMEENKCLKAEIIKLAEEYKQAQAAAHGKHSEANAN